MLLAFAMAAALQLQDPPPESASPTETPAPAVDALAPEPETTTPPIEPAATAVEPEVPPPPTIVDGRELDCGRYHLQIKAEEIDGKKKSVRTLQLCAFRGSTRASWLRTLRDVRMKVAGSDEITSESKARIDAELDSEIKRVSNEPDEIEQKSVSGPKAGGE